MRSNSNTTTGFPFPADGVLFRGFCAKAAIFQNCPIRRYPQYSHKISQRTFPLSRSFLPEPRFFENTESASLCLSSAINDLPILRCFVKSFHARGSASPADRPSAGSPGTNVSPRRRRILRKTRRTASRSSPFPRPSRRSARRRPFCCSPRAENTASRRGRRGTAALR